MVKGGKLESKIQNEIVKYLKSRGGEVLNFHGGSFQTPGIPDLYYAEGALGQMWFEVKRPGEPHPVTALQATLFNRLEAQGVPVFVVHSVDEVAKCLIHMSHLNSGAYIDYGHWDICLGCAVADRLRRWRYRREVKPDDS